MSAVKNKQVLLAARPQGFPKDSDFELRESPVPSPGDGQFLVGISYLSVDPYMRGRMNAHRTYADPVALGDVMIGGAVGKVLESRHENFKAGDYVVGTFGWQQYAVSDGKGVRRVDPSVAPVSTALGALGMPGLTAYFGMLDIGAPKAGETVVVSGAAGAVGSYAGQIAKIHGCRVIGIAGSFDKTEWIVEELGFDGAFNYQATADYGAKLAELCPNGVDVYFDNVGGTITDAVFPKLNTLARVPICGQISQYNAENPETGPRLLQGILWKQVRVEGFLVSRFGPRFKEGLAQLTRWVQSGQLKYREDVAIGIENAVAAFLGMLKGRNIGKQIVKISDL